MGTGYFAEGINGNKAASIQLYRCPPSICFQSLPKEVQAHHSSPASPSFSLSLSFLLLMDDKNMHAYNSCLFSFFIRWQGGRSVLWQGKASHTPLPHPNREREHYLLY